VNIILRPQKNNGNNSKKRSRDEKIKGRLALDKIDVDGDKYRGRTKKQNTNYIY
jgi:hypothetical protein